MPRSGKGDGRVAEATGEGENGPSIRMRPSQHMAGRESDHDHNGNRDHRAVHDQRPDRVQAGEEQRQRRQPQNDRPDEGSRQLDAVRQHWPQRADDHAGDERQQHDCRYHAGGAQRRHERRPPEKSTYQRDQERDDHDRQQRDHRHQPRRK